MQRIAVIVMVVASISVGALACGDKGGPPDPPQVLDSLVHSVLVVPQNPTVKIGEQVQLSAAVNAGAAVTERSVIWWSSNTTIASVNATGLVTPGTHTGTVTIMAAAKADTIVKGASVVTVVAAGSTTALATPGR